MLFCIKRWQSNLCKWKQIYGIMLLEIFLILCFISSASIKTHPANICLDEDVLKTSFVFVFRRRLQDVFKTSLSRPIYSSWPYVFKTSSRRFQDVFKTSSRLLAKMSSRRFQDVQNVLGNTILRHLGDVFKTSRRCTATAKTIIYRRFAWVTLPRNLLSLCKIPKSDKNFSSFNFSLCYTF